LQTKKEDLWAKTSQNKKVWIGNLNFGTVWSISQDPMHISKKTIFETVSSSWQF